MSRIRFWLAGSLLAVIPVVSAAQEPTQQSPQKGGGQRKGGGGVRMAPPAPDGSEGFEAIFNGKTLDNWDGDPKFWRVEEGGIVGESTPDKQVGPNTFIIWRGGKPANFELKLQYKINNTNSGIQYRSVEMPEAGKWVLKGYQADIDAQNRYSGQLYEERGRGFLAMRGQFTRMWDGGKKTLIGSPGDGDALKAVIKENDWNDFHVIARDNMIVHVLNGHVMCAFIDDDPKGRAMEGLLGFQLHSGPPMKVEFRNILFRKL
jgi:hypothetical protein